MGLFRRHADAVVAELTWRRTVELADVEWVTVRSKRRPLSTARNVRVDYEQDLENDQTRTVYEFEEERWTPGRVIVAEGTGQSGVHWPEYKLGPYERVRLKSDLYVAVFTLAGSGKERKADIDEANWRTMEKGAPYRLKLGILGDIRWMAPATG
jgi:hypothetical protein